MEVPKTSRKKRGCSTPVPWYPVSEFSLPCSCVIVRECVVLQKEQKAAPSKALLCIHPTLNPCPCGTLEESKPTICSRCSPILKVKWTSLSHKRPIERLNSSQILLCAIQLIMRDIFRPLRVAVLIPPRTLASRSTAIALIVRNHRDRICSVH